MTINSEIALGNSGVWNIGGSLIANGIISGAFSLEKRGTGSLTLSGDNSFNGQLKLTAGTLRATTSANALGLGTLNLAGGILQLANDTGLNFARNTLIGANNTGNVTIQSDRITAGAGITHTLGTLEIKATLFTVAKGANVTSGTAGMTFGATTLSVNNTTFSTSAGALLTVASITGGGQNRPFTITGAGDTVSGAITIDGGALTKSGTGSLTLSGASTYTGDTSVTGGKMIVNGSLGATAVTVAGGAILSGTGTIGTNAAPSGVPTAGAVVLNSGATDAARGAIDLTNGSVGTLSFAAKTAATTVLTIGGTAGNTSILSFDVGATTDRIALGTNARLNIGAGGGLVRLTSLGGITNTPQTLISSTTASVGAGTLANMVLDSTTGNFSGFTLGLVVNSNNLDLGKTANAAAAAYWKGTNDGVWTTFTGGNANISNFATDIGGTNATGKVGATTDVTFNANTAANFGNTTLGENFTIKSLTYGGNAASAVGIGGSDTLTIMNGVTVATGSATGHTISTKVALGANQTWTVTDIAQVLNATNEISGGFALTKNGDGNLTFSAANTYTGDTIIKDGTLKLDGIGSVLSTKIIVGDTGSSGAVLDVSGTTSNFEVTASQTLSGIGTINGGASTIQVNGTIAPGDVATGTLTSQGNINLSSTSFLQIDLNSVAQYDQLNVVGDVTLAGMLNVDTSAYTQNNDDLFFLVVNDGADAISGTFSGVADLSTVTFGSQQFLVSYFGDSLTNSFTGGNDFVMQTVPEPSTALLGGLGVLFLLRRRRNA
jgi:autotransporter-associated beta strand protein